jgi:hypothetical protein
MNRGLRFAVRDLKRIPHKYKYGKLAVCSGDRSKEGKQTNKKNYERTGLKPKTFI